MSLAERFHRLYAGLERAHGATQALKNAPRRDGKVEVRSFTRPDTVTNDTWEDHLEGRQGLGIVPVRDDGTCRFAVIDVDNYGLDFAALCAKVMDMNLPLIPVRSKSGGAHLTVFFSEDVPAAIARSALQEWAIALGYPGSIEIFPKQDALLNEQDTGNWINMPYYNHLETDRFAFIHGKQATATQFVNWAEQNKINLDTLEGITPQVESDFDDGPPCLQQLAIHGFPEGGRNNALFNIGVYLRQKHEGEDWEDLLDEMNQKLMDPPLPSREVQTIAKSLKKKEYFYRCKEQPIQPACNRGLCLKRKYGVGQNVNEVGVNIDSITKHLTDPPLWYLDVDGQRMCLSTPQLMDPNKFRTRYLELHSKLIPRIRPRDWDQMIQEKLKTHQEVAAPEDASLSGQIKEYLFTYLTGQAMAQKKEELATGKPWREGNKVYYRATPFKEWLSGKVKNATDHMIYEVMRDAGATGDHQVWMPNGSNIRCWMMEIEGDDTPLEGATWDDTEF